MLRKTSDGILNISGAHFERLLSGNWPRHNNGVHQRRILRRHFERSSSGRDEENEVGLHPDATSQVGQNLELYLK